VSMATEPRATTVTKILFSLVYPTLFSRPRTGKSAVVLELNRKLNNLTRQLHQANAELHHLNGLKNPFLGMAAHDLRRLIDVSLDVAILESGTLRLELAPTTAGEPLHGALELCRLAAARKKVALSVDTPDDGPTLTVDASTMRQVLVNLVGNAVECSVPGQSVQLTAGWNDSTREIDFVVRDQGAGIAPEDQARIFQPFAQAANCKTDGERSVGLGLAIARLVVQAHHGRLWVESALGRGTAFFVPLPVDATNNLTGGDPR